MTHTPDQVAPAADDSRRGTAQDLGRQRLLAPAYAATTVGMFALIALNAFEAMAVATVMPTVARDLDGVGLFALAFAGPLASGVVGMVAAGIWSDRRGPAAPLLLSMVVFAAGLVVCGLAPTMEVLVVGRLVQGFGGGALMVGLYVAVGLCYPRTLQPAVFASFAAAWVLPALFGPGIAALVASVLGWRWVFLGVVLLIALAGVLVTPRLRNLRARPEQVPDERRSRAAQLIWATVAAVAVLSIELLGSRAGARALLALLALAVTLLALRPLMPPTTLHLGRGLPSVIGVRGMLSAAFFATEAYLAFVLQDHWGLTPGHAGIALSAVGVVWAGASQVQSRLGDRVSDQAAMRVGTTLVLVGILGLWVAVWLHLPATVAAASYVLGGAGMGFGYPRTGVAMLSASTESDRGFNSSAISIADALGGALSLAVAGMAFTIADRAGLDPFLAVFAVAGAFGVLGVLAASRTRVRAKTPQRPTMRSF